ncbi:MAG: class I SAM-dependent methyltransferase [Deltaproteobacteria bacterium]|nr:class I SAM-dependent methyltransferase [Deltaproteobacteria bacterium]
MTKEVKEHFERTSWSEDEFVRHFIEHADRYIPERKFFKETLLTVFEHYMKDNNNVRVLELGCGSGEMAEILTNSYPGIELTLTDASVEMLKSAQKRFKDSKTNFIETTFESILSGDVKLGNFDFVFSSLALHHLTPEERKEIFKVIHSHLNPDGFFMNMDTHKAPSEEIEKLYLSMKIKAALNNKTEPGLKSEIDEFIRRYHDPEHYKRLSTLEMDVASLKEAGFSNVDIYYKNGMFACFGGNRQRRS